MVGRTTSKDDPTEPNKVASYLPENELSRNETSVAVANEPKKRFVDILELTVKLATAVLGVLYVLGLLISNIQTMTLGISDFSSIHARNVITGFGFIFYSALPCLVILWIAILLYVTFFWLIKPDFSPFKEKLVRLIKKKLVKKELIKNELNIDYQR